MSVCTTKQRGALALLSLASMAVGVTVWYTATQMPPKVEMARVMRMSLPELQRDLGLKSTLSVLFDWRQKHGWALEAERMLLALVCLFYDLCSTRFGQGGFYLVTSVVVPIMNMALIDAMKPAHSTLLGVLAVTFIYSLGQLICIGAAVPLLYVPLYALVRALDLERVFPTRAFASPTVPLLKVVSLLAGALTIGSALVPTTHRSWVWINIGFQLYPLLFLPLAPAYYLLPHRTQSAHSGTVADQYRENWISTAIFYWVGLAMIAPTVMQVVRGERIRIHDAELLILIDACGAVASAALFTLIDCVADANLKPNPHAQCCTATSEAKSLGMAVVVGPGCAFADYLARREEAVADYHAGKQRPKTQ